MSVRAKREIVVLLTLTAVVAMVWLARFARKTATQTARTTAEGITLTEVTDFGGIVRRWKEVQGTEYKTAGRDVFIVGVAVRKEKSAVAHEGFRIYNLPRPESVFEPVLNMVFFGYGTLPANGPRQAFLKERHGDDVHIVSEGNILENRIRVTHIGNEKLEFEDIQTGRKGSTALEAPTT